MAERLEDTVEIARQLIREYYNGNPEPWFSRLCSKSLWLGTGERTIVGEEAIRQRLSRLKSHSSRVLLDEYTRLPITSRCEAVTAQVTLGRDSAAIMARYSLLFQLIGGDTKLILLHADYEFLHHGSAARASRSSAYQAVLDVLLETSQNQKLAVPSEGSTIFLPASSLLYVESLRSKTLLHCVDQFIECGLSITAMRRLLPRCFCHIHRCYSVNSKYVMAIRRYEVKIITGETLPVPFHTYKEVKERLVLDLTELQYLSSAGLRVLLAARKALGSGEMLVRGANEAVMEVLEITGFTDILSIE